MPIPTAACADDIPADVCCDTIWLIGDRIRTVATAGLMECFDPACADREFRSFSSWGERLQDPLGESLIVSWIRNSVVTTRGLGSMAPATATRAEYLIELRENGWPAIESANGSIIERDSDVMNIASKHATGHAERMWRAVVDAAQRQIGAGALFALPANSHIIHGSIQIGDLTPIDPQGRQVGSKFNVSVSMALP